MRAQLRDESDGLLDFEQFSHVGIGERRAGFPDSLQRTEFRDAYFDIYQTSSCKQLS